MAVVQPGSEETGNLFVVSTPIGNLGDVTQRSIEILNAVSLIAAEDTRRTRILLNRYQIRTNLSSYNSFNKIKKGREFIERLKKGEDLALVSAVYPWIGLFLRDSSRVKKGAQRCWKTWRRKNVQ